MHGRDALNGWVSGIHAILPDLTFVIEVGPITDDEHLVVRWKAHGTYRGGFPSAPPEAIGRQITFTGTDTLRIADGKLAEYWANVARRQRVATLTKTGGWASHAVVEARDSVMLLADGSLKANIAARFPLDDVAAALTLAESRTVNGKIILLP